MTNTNDQTNEQITEPKIDPKIFQKLIKQQKSELTEGYIYQKLALISDNEENKKTLDLIANEEFRHYAFWNKITKTKSKPNKIRVFFYVLLARVFGLSFSLKLMEAKEEQAQAFYLSVGDMFEGVKELQQEEQDHETKLINILHDERLNYAGAVVLGLNDALVELSGTLAGLSLAFSSSKTIGITGIIMGIAASLSMSSSGYLASREDEKSDTDPLKAALYTGFAYLFTVIFLTAPYFIFLNVTTALTTMIITTLLIIAAYTFYITVAKNLSFKRRFLEMAFISLGVAAISFAIGYFVKHYLGIDL